MGGKLHDCCSLFLVREVVVCAGEAAEPVDDWEFFPCKFAKFESHRPGPFTKALRHNLRHRAVCRRRRPLGSPPAIRTGAASALRHVDLHADSVGTASLWCSNLTTAPPNIALVLNCSKYLG